MLFSILFYCIFCYLIIKCFQFATTGYCRTNICLVGKTALITGGNLGLGYQCALNLASRGCRVIIADISDARKSVETIKEKTKNPNISSLHIDLASFDSVRKFAKDFLKDEKSLDILINNAGSAGFYTKTSDGVYKTMQINHLGHFLLTHLLAPILKETKNSRVVFVSSLLAFTHDFQHGESINELCKFRLPFCQQMFDYGNSKLVVLATTTIFAERFEKYDVTVSACHPGLVNTGIFRTTVKNARTMDFVSHFCYFIVNLTVKLFGKSAREGSEMIVHTALASNVKPGDFIVDKINFPKPAKLNESYCEEIWQESLKLASVSPQEEVQ